jgi:hypothetical protein
MFGEDVAAPAAPGAFSQIGSAITGAVTGLAAQFPNVATSVLTAKATEAATKAQTKLTEAETKKLVAQKALLPTAAVATIKQESKWAIPLLVGGVGLLGVALWMRSRKK